MMRLRLLLLSLLLAAWSGASVAAGCSGTAVGTSLSDDAGSDASASPADQACTDLSRANCAKIDSCVKDGTMHAYGDLATCQTRQLEACLAGQSVPNSGNSPALVETCATALASASCDDYEGNRVAGCQPKVGALPNGSPCAFQSQCASSFCALRNGTNCGTCSVATRPGDSCATTNCAYGQTCVTTNMQCQFQGVGEVSCDKDHPCGGYLQNCVMAADAGSGTCQGAATTVGAACDPARQTGSGCASIMGLYCASASKTCLNDTFVGVGSPCGLINGVQVACSGPATCSGAGTTPAMCKALAREGGPCDTVAGPKCMLPGRCVTGSPTATSGTCRAPDGNCH